MGIANHRINEEVRRTIGAVTFPTGTIVFAKIGAASSLKENAY